MKGSLVKNYITRRGLKIKIMKTLKTMHNVDNLKNKQCNNQISKSTNYNNGQL
jgi:hypothetical protein